MDQHAYRALMQHAHRVAMDGHGELAQQLRDAITAARQHDLARKEIGAHRALVAACNRLSAEAEEYEFEDGLGRGAQQGYWDAFEDALEASTLAIAGSGGLRRGAP
jgi:hypothetical protein